MSEQTQGKQRVESRESRAESREQRAESRECATKGERTSQTHIATHLAR
jgi:hypothetical protein